jgi:hypothetical protein
MERELLVRSSVKKGCMIYINLEGVSLLGHKGYL